MGEEVPGLYDDVAPRTAVEGVGQLGETAEDEATGDPTARTGAQHWPANRGGTDAAAKGVDELLPNGRGEGDLRGTGWLDTPEAEVRDLAAMEAHIRACEGLDEARTGQGEGVEISYEWARAMVECRGLAHERGLSEILL